ncbi:MAG TPA: PEP-CTERM sorting domain-containing protein [Pyrinomonadaceae bacterium]|nr:PEP-CTERM sorting domain-containing protein [Pyrinomonadaceae bacterium]
MNLHSPKDPRNSPKRWRAVRAFTAIALITFLFTAGTAQADSVRIDKVVQTLSRYQGPAELRLGTTQDPVTGQTKTSTPTNGPRTDGPVTPASGETAKPDGLSIVQDPQKLGVEVIEEAEVEGTICDCGEILYADGGFPKWPLLFLAAVPLVFINDCDDCDENPITQPTPTPPPPTPTPTPTPEPATLLLFGTGLMAVGASLRRRRRVRNS